MGLTTVTEPSVEPVDLELAKSHLRIETDIEDELIRMYVASARRWVEELTKRALVNRTIDYTFDYFPYPDGTVHLPMGKVQSITSVSYYDTDGNVQTFTDYQSDLSSDEGGKIAPSPDFEWPEVETFRLGGVTIRYDAGFGSTGYDVPESLRTAVLYRLSDLYEYRGSFDGQGTANAKLECDQWRILAC